MRVAAEAEPWEEDEETAALLAAYQLFAEVYDDFNHMNDYEMWLGRALLPELKKHGLRQGQALDVGCGSGRAFKPLRKRGWDVVGCDLSPAMLRLAENEGEGFVALACVDMRALPRFGDFELILSLNDPINYLLGDRDLERTFAGMRSNLAQDGLIIFDCSSKMTFETLLSVGLRTIEHRGRRWIWRGAGQVNPSKPIFEYTIEGDGIGKIRLRERFRSESEVKKAMSTAGLRCVATLGMEEVEDEVLLTSQPNEDRQFKVIYIAAKGIQPEQ